MSKKLRQVPWKDDVKSPKYEELEGKETADVAIIGGGITSILTAYLLGKQGKKVVLLEKKQLGEYATKHTTACTTKIIDTDLSDLISIFGKEQTKKIIESHAKAIDTLEDIVKEENIDCEFMRVSNFIFATTPKESTSLYKELNATKELEINAPFRTGDALGFKNYGCIEVKDQAKFHPLKFCYSLAEIASRLGVQIYEKSEAVEIDEKSMTVKTKKGEVEAPWIIGATYEPFQEPLGLFFKKGMYGSFAFELHIPGGLFPEAIYEDMQNPYHYFRIDQKEGYDRMIIGGEDHRRDIPVYDEKNFDALIEYIGRTFPGLKYEMVHKWDGPILEPSDGLAFIGPYKNPKILYAFGFSGNGMTYSAIAAKIFKDTILGNGNPYSEIYRTNRHLKMKPLITKGLDYAEELWNGAIKNSFRSH